MIRNALLVLCLLLPCVALAAPKVAVVRVSDIYSELDVTKEMTADINAKREAVLKSTRAEAYRGSLQELELLQKELIKVASHDRATRKRLEKEFLIKRQEDLTLKREFDSHRQEQTKEINTEMVERMEKILADIQIKVSQVSTDKGYDWVLDISGKTNTGVPFVLYAKDAEDITPEEVLSAMGITIAGSPAEEAE